MEDAYWRGKALRVVALSLVQAGHGELALEVARTIPVPPAEQRALAAVAALSLAQAGGKVSKAFTEALEAVRAIEDARQRGEALGAVALSLAQAGGGEEASKTLLKPWRP